MERRRGVSSKPQASAGSTLNSCPYLPLPALLCLLLVKTTLLDQARGPLSPGIRCQQCSNNCLCLNLQVRCNRCWKQTGEGGSRPSVLLQYAGTFDVQVKRQCENSHPGVGPPPHTPTPFHKLIKSSLGQPQSEISCVFQMSDTSLKSCKHVPLLNSASGAAWCSG